MQEKLKKGMKKLAVTSLMTGAAALGMVATERPVEGAMTDGFLRIPNIPGESGDSKHKGEIDIITYSNAFGFRDGRYECSTIKVVKKIDSASPKLAAHAVTGATIPQMTLALRLAGKDQQEFYRLDLRDVNVVTSEITVGRGNEELTETVTLRMKSAALEYRPRNPNGTLGAPVKENIVCPAPSAPARR